MRPTTEALALGWPLALLLGWMLLRARERRRRLGVRVRDAVHELRRPLQALALTAEAGAAAHQLELVSAALTDLERALLGQAPALRARALALRPLVQGAVDRWSLGARGAAEGRSTVELRWLAGDVRAVVDPRWLAQAMDNLIANALEHGSSPVTVEVTRSASGLRLSVRNRVARGQSPTDRAQRTDPWSELRGHGLRIVSAIAVAHGGRFLFDCARGWAVGTLELPLGGRVPEALAAS